jgi:hypothetical protein
MAQADQGAEPLPAPPGIISAAGATPDAADHLRSAAEQDGGEAGYRPGTRSPGPRPEATPAGVPTKPIGLSYMSAIGPLHWTTRQLSWPAPGGYGYRASAPRRRCAGVPRTPPWADRSRRRRGHPGPARLTVPTPGPANGEVPRRLSEQIAMSERLRPAAISLAPWLERAHRQVRELGLGVVRGCSRRILYREA